MSAPCRVLLIEDNPGDVRLVRVLLGGPAEARFVLESAERLTEGLGRLSEGTFDALLLDLNLPDSQGLETFLRVAAEAPQIPAVVMTGTDDVGLGVRAVQAGAQDYLVKGRVDGELLARSIRYAVERKRVEACQRDSEAQSRSITDAAHDAIVIMDGDGTIARWNPAAERMFGYSEAEALGRDLHSLIAPERFHAPFRESFSRFQRTGDGPLVGSTVEMEARRKGGSEFPVELSLSVVKRGTEWQAIGIVRDATERRRAEELQARAGKLEALGTLSAGVAHDFNNILLAIRGNAALVRSDLPPGHAGQKSLAEIMKASQRATDLVRRILTFSRPQDQKREVLSLGPAVEEALELVRATLPAMIRIQADLAGDVPPVSIDLAQVQQVIVNLAANAAHAIGEGLGLVRIGLDETTLAHEADAGALGLPPGRYVRLSVSDDGCGMDSATIARIFDPFFTTRPPGKGSGLGLSVVHGIMKGHGGTVTAESEPGRGSRFRVYFPAEEGPAGAPGRSDSEAVTGSGERILFVDDEEALVYLVPRLLEKLGYRVTAHGSAELALEEFRARSAGFDLVVTDLSMPGMSGLDLARALLAIRPDVPIVLMSGHVRPELEEEARRIGIREVLLKPDTVEEMGRVLQDALRSRPA